VQRCRIVKDTQKRSGEVWVFGERGDIGFVSTAVDPTIRSWKRRPLRIITSSDAKNRKEAREEAWEEIFEGKVGALEIELTIPYEGTIIRQNHMAMVNIGSIGLTGIFYVVGVSLSGGLDGYTQTVRMREKNYAISRRAPSDPELLKDPGDQASLGDVGTGLGTALGNAGVRWAQSFASAAREFHGGWDYATFLGVLLAMCDKETGFRNVRQTGDTEWYPAPDSFGTGVHGDAAFHKWKETFANKAGNPLNPLGDEEAGTGPMQLTTPAFKVWADEYGGKSDEYSGGRWVPQANIRAGARVFAGKLSGLDPHKDSNIWIGVERYNGAGAKAVAYAADVRKRYEQKFKETVTEVVDSATVIPGGEKTEYTVKDANGNGFEVRVPVNAPADVKVFINYLIRQLGKPYGWGDEGPGSFDCSGLIIAASKHAGNNLIFSNSTRPTTYSLDTNSSLQKITKDSLLPGDLVLFARGGDVHHVGIYLNDGHMIHAPKPGDVVKISSINSSYYINEWHGARRIFDWQGRGRTSGD
jgi:cell wall-associated NlpC family hydrolase